MRHRPGDGFSGGEKGALVPIARLSTSTKFHGGGLLVAWPAPSDRNRKEAGAVFSKDAGLLN
jgi:nickel-dependent lactate racemase